MLIVASMFIELTKLEESMLKKRSQLSIVACD